jgi:hypothetical protein
MLRFNPLFPRFETGYSVWVELQTYDELHEEFRASGWTLSQVIAERGGVDIMSPITHLKLHTVTYADLLKAFPTLDAEKVYAVIHYE